jgi:Rieske Fe-S protein
VNRAGSGYHCPCHGSVFDEQGSVKGGPAPRALTWFQVTLSKDNRLLVDKGRTVAADKYLVLPTSA